MPDDLDPTLEQALDDRDPPLERARANRDPLLGVVVDGRYAIRRRIGEGGMGIVYEATQLSVDRAVAIKVIRDSLHHDRAAARRFLREARLLTEISHPNIVQVFDYGETGDGAPYLVTELLTGKTLAEVLVAAGRLDARRACEVGIQLCDALAAAHDRGIVHRDLKPANIILLDAPAVRDLVKVLDFGIAKSLSIESAPATTLTEAGVMLGTPLYMAPESMGSTTPDPRSDLYSLGCILYELVAGAPPFSDRAINMVLARHLAEPPPLLPVDVPSPVADVIMALLRKSPDARPASAAAVRVWLQAIVDAPASPADGSSDDADDVPTLLHQPRLAQRVTVREIPPPPRRPSPVAASRRPAAPTTIVARSQIPRAVPVIVVSLSLLVFAAALALLFRQLAS